MDWFGVCRDRAPAGAGQPKKDEVKDPARELQGGWNMVLLFVNGEEVPADQAKSGELVVVDDEYRPKLGATVEASTFKIDATKKPKAIDFTYTSGFSKGKTIKGIYKIDGDDLTICRGLSPENDRPDEFAAPDRFRAHAGGVEAIEDRRRSKDEGHSGRAQAVRGDLEIRLDRR